MGGWFSQPYLRAHNTLTTWQGIRPQQLQLGGPCQPLNLLKSPQTIISSSVTWWCESDPRWTWGPGPALLLAGRVQPWATDPRVKSCQVLGTAWLSSTFRERRLVAVVTVRSRHCHCPLVPGIPMFPGCRPRTRSA